MRVARRIADAYGADGPVAVAVAGSVGAGLADMWSDLEIDCYWDRSPSESDRRAPMVVLGATATEFWAYDPDDREWSEDYSIDHLSVTVSNFTTTDLSAFIDDVTIGADVDPVKHMRLAAITRCTPLRGEDLFREWKDRAARYPDALVTAMIEQTVNTRVLRGWGAREALARRGDRVAVRALLSRIETAVISGLLAVNKRYQPHSLLKWQSDLVRGLPLQPEDLEPRLDRMWGEADPALAEAKELLLELVEIVRAHTDADVSDFLEELSERRRPIHPSVE